MRQVPGVYEAKGGRVMKVRISREYTLQAAHRLPRVYDGHKCGRLHGHTYLVRVTLQGVPDAHMGWFMDFAEFDAVYASAVHDVLDHRSLNDAIENPTTENLCAWVADRLRPKLGALLYSVAISENDRSLVEWFA